MSLTLRVNGAERVVEVESETPLLYVLRNDLKLKGTRFGCGRGQCGTCTVIVDGAAVQSCDVPVGAVVSKAITTIEGIAGDQRLHPLQQAFVDHQAGQCGYCATGIIMAAKVLLDSNPNSSEQEIRQALVRNLCRCGTHQRILRAIASVASARGKAVA